MKVAICGLGRIGRCISRILTAKEKTQKITTFIDIEEDIENLCYLLNHDSTYGWLSNKFRVSGNKFLYDKNEIRYYKCDDYLNLDWSNIDILLDCSGVNRDWSKIRDFCLKFNKKVIVTHHPEKFPGEFLVEGVNKNNDANLISTSICDVVGIAPIICSFNNWSPLKSISIVSLHPWLSYQNLLDGSLKSVSSPGHSWKDYALGRASTESLIPKQTTITRALKDVLPFELKIESMSYRVPTASVTSAILHLNFFKELKEGEKYILNSVGKELDEKFFSISDESLVSIDFKKRKEASIIDSRFFKIVDKNSIRLICWYDNEWGYSESIVRRIFC